jgi:hypothetical protein
LENYQNNIFYFLKFIFDINTLKYSKIIKKKINLKQYFLKNIFLKQKQTHSKILRSKERM